MDQPEIVIQSPGARFVIRFDRTAAACWVLTWPDFAGREPEAFTGLALATAEVADFIGRTEF